MPPRHLFVICHGINADADTLSLMHTELAAAFHREAPGDFLVLNASSNSGFHVSRDTGVLGWITGVFAPAVQAHHRTRDGIDTGGDRLVSELEAVLHRLPTIDTLSFFGHSLGGVYCRYVAGQLFLRGWIDSPDANAHSRTVSLSSPKSRVPAFVLSPTASAAASDALLTAPVGNGGNGRRLRFAHYYSFSAPHVGSLQMSETYSMGLMRVLSSTVLGKTCDQLMLQDHPHPTTFDARVDTLDSALATADALPMDAEDATIQTPLMWRLCHEPYLIALRAFKTRTLYSNSENDSFVPFSTAALSRLNPVIGCDADTLAQYKPASYEHVVDVNAMLTHGYPKTESAASAPKDEMLLPSTAAAPASAGNTDSVTSIAARAKALGLGAVSTARPLPSSAPAATAASQAATDAQDWPAAFAEYPIVRGMFSRLGGLALVPSSSASSSAADASALRWRRFAILDRYFLPHFDGGDRWREVIRHIAESTLREHAADRRARIQREWQERPDAKPAAPVVATATSVEAALRDRSFGASRVTTPGPSEGSRGVGSGSAALQLHAMQLGKSLAEVKQ